MRVITILLCLISFKGVSQSDTIVLENGKHDVGLLSNELKNGLWNRFFKDGKIERIEHYTDGKLDGEWKGFYPNGQLEFHANFKKQMLFEFVYFITDKNTHESVGSKIIKSPEGLNQDVFGLLLKSFEDKNERINNEITPKFREEESTMIGKRINGQITSAEYKEFDRTKSEKAVRMKADSILNDKYWSLRPQLLD